MALKGQSSCEKGERLHFGSTPRRKVHPRRFDGLTILEGIEEKGFNSAYSQPSGQSIEAVVLVAAVLNCGRAQRGRKGRVKEVGACRNSLHFLGFQCAFHIENFVSVGFY